MRVVLAASDSKSADWLADVLSAAGFSVAVLSDPSPTSPELRGAELLIVDSGNAAALAGAGPSRRLLIAPRDATVSLTDVESGFRDVIAIPSPPEEVVARVRHVLSTP
jgi:DNA-binding response OmpR family regulator